MRWRTLEAAARPRVRAALSAYRRSRHATMGSSMRSRLENTVAAALNRIGLQRDTVILLALSGGADSVALLHALAALRERCGYRLAAAHFNHHLRGDESDRDQAFV